MAEDVQVISHLVEQYISKNPRTIMLPIVSATNDAANQIVLNRAKEHDPNRLRILGIISRYYPYFRSSSKDQLDVGSQAVALAN